MQVKKGGIWTKPGEDDKLDDFTQWKVDGTIDQFVDRELASFIDDVKPHLVHLELSKCNDLTAKGFAKLIDARGMTDLTIRSCTRFNDEAVTLLFPKMEAPITDAAPMPLSDILGEGLAALPLSPIKRLDIIECSVTDASLEYLPASLERLRLDGCSEISDKGVPIIADRLKKLQHLSLKNTGVTFVEIPVLLGLGWSSNPWTFATTANIVKASEELPLPNLRKLEVDGCSMKGYRGDFGNKLKVGLKKYRENIEVLGIAP